MPFICAFTMPWSAYVLGVGLFLLASATVAKQESGDKA